ncbi:MAG: formylglycine-generating enzyme family protein [Akkermansiaceae bacterium]|nr:formylglycine-generating enzyme family protein [Akkermansiaceae bacterium]
MKTIIKQWIAGCAVIAAVAALSAAPPARAAAPAWHFECSGGVPNKLCWQTKTDETYDLWRSDDLAAWIHVEGYPRAGTGGVMEHPFTAGTRGFFRIASQAAVPEGFALIPAGSFQMGDQSSPLVGFSDELPVHTVQVSAFYMAKYAVTKEEWDAVRAWGLNNGYDINAAGVSGKGTNHPVHSITWYDMVKWCNARSQKENLTPCYTMTGSTYKAGQSDAVVCNWNATGYRLPSEAEWEKAARGGQSGKNFPWGDSIKHSNANYRANGSAYSYDTSGYTSYTYHPTYAVGGYPYSSPVGSFAPNGYGLYDMAGNMWEWCWDWSGSYPSTSQTDPRGASSGSLRVGRGGSWDDYAINCRVAIRGYGYPTDSFSSLGFRVARSSVP